MLLRHDHLFFFLFFSFFLFFLCPMCSGAFERTIFLCPVCFGAFERTIFFMYDIFVGIFLVLFSCKSIFFVLLGDFEDFY